MSEPASPLANLLDAYPYIGVLQDATYRPIAEHLFEECHGLPREMAIDLMVTFLRGMHALPFAREPTLVQILPEGSPLYTLA